MVGIIGIVMPMSKIGEIAGYIERKRRTSCSDFTLPHQKRIDIVEDLRHDKVGTGIDFTFEVV